MAYGEGGNRMISAEEQKKVADLVKQTKDLILKEMDEEEVMIKGAANYVTNVDTEFSERRTWKGFSGNFPDRRRERESGAFKGGNLLDP